jgi:hypothetical protein
VPNPTKRREKALASDQRAGIWARSSARNRQRSFARRSWKVLVGIAVVMSGLSAIVSLFVPRGFERGFVIGAGVASMIAVLHNLVLLGSGTASTIMGDIAEQWTAQELRPLTAHGWKLVNHFGLSYGDNDHVLVGPGGVILLETKWNGHQWNAVEKDPRVRAALSQVRDGARHLMRWSGLKKHWIDEVRTVVVLWGRSKEAGLLPPGGRRDPGGTVVIHGKDVKDWALRLGRDKVTPEQTSGLWHEMERHLQGRDALEQARNPLPRSMQELVLMGSGCVLLTWCAVIASAEVLKYSQSFLTWSVFAVLTVVGGLVARKQVSQRALVNAWLLGSVLAPILGLAELIWAQPR